MDDVLLLCCGRHVADAEVAVRRGMIKLHDLPVDDGITAATSLFQLVVCMEMKIERGGGWGLADGKGAAGGDWRMERGGGWGLAVLFTSPRA